jgi:flagellar biogenesis protein FliO
MSARIQQMNVTSDIKILDSRAVSTKLNVHLIEVHKKEVLFAESATGIEKLAEFSTEARNFEDVMKRKET